MKKTIAEQLNIKEFPFEIKDRNGNRIYWEDATGFVARYEYDSGGRLVYYESLVYWEKREYDSEGNEIYFENSEGKIIDNRPKEVANKEHFGDILIKDTDIATIERLHDMVLDAGLSQIDSEELKRSRELIKKMYAYIYQDY